MKLPAILPFVKELLATSLEEGDIAVDATIGKGQDTLFLTQHVGETGKVYGFDVQKDALEQTKERLSEHGVLHRAFLYLKGHEHVADVIPEKDYDRLKAAVFNLGYLPGSDKSVTTTGHTTIDALEQLLRMMPPGGVIILVVYHGHEEGKQERDKLLQYVSDLDQKQVHVMRYGFINQIGHPPFIIGIEKR